MTANFFILAILMEELRCKIKPNGQNEARLVQAEVGGLGCC